MTLCVLLVASSPTLSVLWENQTMSTNPESCPDCGFVWDGVSRSDAIEGINDSIEAFIGVIEDASEMALVRPESKRWSIVEYASHVRDVLLSLRERTIIASILDEPTGTPIFRDERVNLGFYSLDSLDDVTDELAFAAGLLSKTIATLPAGFENRPIKYSPVTPLVVTIGWMAAQAFHEASHHLGDARENLRLLTTD
jgi:hypothetical protein